MDRPDTTPESTATVVTELATTWQTPTLVEIELSDTTANAGGQFDGVGYSFVD